MTDDDYAVANGVIEAYCFRILNETDGGEFLEECRDQQRRDEWNERTGKEAWGRAGVSLSSAREIKESPLLARRLTGCGRFTDLLLVACVSNGLVSRGVG